MMYLTVPTAPLVRPASIQRFLVNSTLQTLAMVMSRKRPPASLALALQAPFPLFQLLQGAIGFPSALILSLLWPSVSLLPFLYRKTI